MNPEQLPAGTVVGDRYVIDAFLAQGGFASVYKAHHQQIGRRLAIKVLDPPGRSAATEAFRERFLSEAKIAARIEHPGVVSVFDFGLLDDGRAFIAMDLLDGHDLETELRTSGPVPASRFVPIFIDCLAALAEGHRQGIVHKDLKPSNLFIVRPNQDGERLVVLDFGIARAFDDPGAHITQEGGFSGTPAYLAPEYIRYQTVSPAMDVYQMGLILIEALTGSQAVTSETSMGYLLAHCLESPRLPTSLLDTRLGEICLRALAKEPEQRFDDAEAFRLALVDVPAADLRDTMKISFDAPLAPHEQELAKTLQFLEVPPEALAQLSGPQRPPPQPSTQQVEPVAEPETDRPVALIAVAAVLIVAVVVALGVISSLREPVPPPLPEAPPPVILDPDNTTAAPVVIDAGPADAAVVDLGFPRDVSAEPQPAVDPEPAPPKPKLRSKPMPRPRPEEPAKPKQPDQPLLLSP